MADLTPSVPSEPTRMTVECYFGLVEAGVLSEDDRVELLEGVIVAMTPHNPPDASGVARANQALLLAIGRRAHVRPQLSLVVGRFSVPEPDLAVVPGCADDYDASHPTTAWLVIPRSGRGPYSSYVPSSQPRRIASRRPLAAIAPPP